VLITEQSLDETLDGRARDLRRRCRLFIPHQAVFIPNKLLFNPRLVCSHPADRSPGELHRNRRGLPTALLRPSGWHRQHTDKGGLTHTREDRGRACANAAGQAVAVLPVVKRWETCCIDRARDLRLCEPSCRA
jgi:hypothetical protein